MTNFRTAKYMPDGTAIDDPNNATMLFDSQMTALTRLNRGVRNVAVLGDSITYDMWNLTSVATSPTTRNNDAVWLSDVTFEHMSHGWASWLGPLSLGALQVIYNGAASGAEVILGDAGDSGTATSLRQQVDELLAHPKWATTDEVVLMFGTNDTDGNNAQSVSLVIQTYAAQLARLAGKGITVCTIMPVDSSIEDGSSGGSSPRWAWIRRFNSALKQLARNSGGRIKMADCNGAVVDPTSATGRAKTGMLRDSVHPTTKAAQLMGAAVVSALMAGATSYPPPDWIVSNADDIALSNTPNGPLNIVPNGLFINGASPGTGWTANNFAGATGTNSLISSPTGLGQAVQFATTGAAKLDSFRLITANLSSLVAAGDRIFAQCWVRIPASSKVLPSLRLVVVVGGVTYLRSCMQNTTSAAYVEGPDGTFDVLMRTPELIIPSGSITNLQISMTGVYGGAAGPTNVLMAHAEGRKVLSDLVV